ncbi:MAG: sulfatase-like hydrolase/transferase [Okeania sp. SIO3B3]|nr:sulfatase-like hydrolase/transferase [Okeania sp. SIO3B3]
MLNHRFDTLAKLLCEYGYHTTGFCNNPLLGVLNNGLKRGFETFYNYCGAFPSVPEWTNPLPKPLSQIWKWYTQQLRKLSYPIQNAFAHSDILFQLSLNPKVVPFWSKLANFKGNTATSIRDTKYFLESVESDTQPHFVFLNLMETHLPYSPPDTFINKFAPYFSESYEARTFMRRYNAETFRWLKPLPKPLPELHHNMLNDMYDAEANYQDHLLAGLLEYLAGVENTMVIIVADHGEGIGEHDFMGHSFVAYQELVHVPLIIKFAEGRAVGKRITETVSTRRLFHTALHAAQIPFLDETASRPAVEVKPFSLSQTVKGRDPEQGVVFSEAYPPANLLNMMKKRNPELVAQFHCDISRRAVYQRAHKLARIDGVQDELFVLDSDPGERINILVS